MSSELTDLDMVVCCRRVPARRGEPHLVTRILEESGYRVREIDGRLPALNERTVVWLLGNANWHPAALRQLREMSDGRRPFTLLWQFEPLPPPRAAGLPWPRLHPREIARIVRLDPGATDVYTNYFRLRNLNQHGLPDLLVVSTPGRQEFLAERGIRSDCVPLGYHPSEHGHDVGLARDIDVLFLGDLTVPRRKRLVRVLRRRGVDVKTMGSWSDPSCFGENRTRILSRTKILLNIQRYPGELSGYRLILGLANRSLPLSEPMYNPAPYVPGKHYVEATIDEMPDVIEHWLNSTYERERIVSQGYRLVIEEVTMQRSIERILEHIEARSSEPSKSSRPERLVEKVDE